MLEKDDVLAEMKNMISKSDEDYPSIMLAKYTVNEIKEQDTLVAQTNVQLSHNNNINTNKTNEMFYDC